MSEAHENQSARLNLRTLLETSQLLSSSLDLSFVLDKLLLVAMSNSLASKGLVLLADASQQGFTVAGVRGLPEIENGCRLEMSIPDSTSIVDPTHIPSVLSGEGIVLLLPIVYQDRVLGGLGLGNRMRGDGYDETDLEFLQSLVNMSSAAVHNSMIVEELRCANRDLDGKIQELNTLFELSSEFNKTLERDHLIRLFSFALMGQMLVQKHLLLHSKPPKDDQPSFEVIACQGIDAAAIPDETLQKLVCAKELLYLEKETDSEWDWLKEADLRMVLPFRQQDESHAVLLLGPKLSQRPYTPGDLEFLTALTNLTITSMMNAYLVEDQIERRRLEEEMRLARNIQEGLLPSSIPTAPGIEISTFASPSLYVAGDYFDVLALSGDRLLVAIADVTGKGVPASLLMAGLQACLRVVYPIEDTLETATSRINRVIHANTDSGKFITFFWGIFDSKTRSFSYTNAGHEPPFHLAATGKWGRLETGGLLLGVMSQAQYERDTIQVESGDVLVLYTDGVNEAMNGDGVEYGEERLQEVISESEGKSAEEIRDTILEDVAAHTGGAPQSDDLTLVVLKGV